MSLVVVYRSVHVSSNEAVCDQLRRAGIDAVNIEDAEVEGGGFAGSRNTRVMVPQEMVTKAFQLIAEWESSRLPNVTRLDREVRRQVIFGSAIFSIVLGVALLTEWIICGDFGVVPSELLTGVAASFVLVFWLVSIRSPKSRKKTRMEETSL